MESVHISASGHIYQHPDRRDETAVRHTAGTPDILACLSARAELDADFTLRSFFRLVENNPEMTRMNPFLAAAAAEAATSPAAGCVTPDFTALVLAKTVELTGAPGEPQMNVFTTFRGKLPEEECGCCFGEIRFHRLTQLLDIPVQLGRLRHVVFGDRTSMLECDTTFSVYEIIEGIAWELGFQGGSQQCSLRR